MKTLETLLSELELFQELEPKYIQFLAGCASNVIFQEGELVTKEGTPANHFYIIRHGSVSVDVHDTRRGYMRLLTVGENEVLGWSWMFPPYRCHFDARAKSLVRAVALDGVCIRKKCDDDQAFGYHFLRLFSRVLIHRLEAARMQMVNVYG
jgi:CRP/FNR family transcriptional regulator, cyclic AMP receptor protein